MLHSTVIDTRQTWRIPIQRGEGKRQWHKCRRRPSRAEPPFCSLYCFSTTLPASSSLCRYICRGRRRRHSLGSPPSFPPLFPQQQHATSLSASAAAAFIDGGGSSALLDRLSLLCRGGYSYTHEIRATQSRNYLRRRQKVVEGGSRKNISRKRGVSQAQP